MVAAKRVASAVLGRDAEAVTVEPSIPVTGEPSRRPAATSTAGSAWRAEGERVARGVKRAEGGGRRSGEVGKGHSCRWWLWRVNYKNVPLLGQW